MESITHPTLHEKITGAIWGGAIGDALGVPVECMLAQEILNQKEGIDIYKPISGNRFLQEIAQKGYKIDLSKTGIISDDTIFTLAGLEAISSTNTLTPLSMITAQKKLFDAYGSIFFGKITAETFSKYTPGDSLEIFKNPSWGNGVMMKQFPYAVFFLQSTDIHKVDQEILALTETTHDTAIAKLAAIFHNRMLMYLLSHDIDTVDFRSLFLSWEDDLALREEKLMHNTADENYDPDTDIKLSPIIDALLTQIDSIENGYPYPGEKIIDTYLISLSTHKNPKINETKKPGFHVASTFGFTYGCFLQHPSFQGLLDAISLGYDTDTQGAIVGNMVGALIGPFYAENYCTELQEYKTIKDAIAKFLNREKSRTPITSTSVDTGNA